ncbi:hypothetical protein GCM10010324_58320 [Streptomyces hiroshimensis]|uniref:Uncharacterized protein n=1 Tax=Streptomyces hiroshimensis TaxID=66424 RepID=A0ABQ2Z536_9ACTN|nr:hypothetical protein GCM10010324_58320 [Streptomyces hiroshimensis]
MPEEPEEPDPGGKDTAAAAPRAAASTVRRGVGLLGVLLDMALVPQSSADRGWACGWVCAWACRWVCGWGARTDTARRVCQ